MKKMTKVELQVRNREISDRMSEIIDKANAEKRELTAVEAQEFNTLEMEAKRNDREFKNLCDQEVAKTQGGDVNAELREFLKGAQPGSKFAFAAKRESIATADTAAHVQGVSVVDLIKTDRPDADILTAAGVPMTTGVTGNKIQWAYAGGVEAAFANELDQTTERKVDLSSQTPIQQRLTVRVRVSNQVLENSDFDLQGLFTRFVSDSIREKINWAAASTSKATATFFGGFAQDTESGTYGAAGYKAGKQVGTYTALGKQVFVDAIKKLAKRNIPLDHAVFVLGSEDYWDAKVTPVDEGSGVMLLGPDNRILGIKVVENNAINRATAKGAAEGHNIGLGNFAGLPVMQHGQIRLSIDGASAVAADTDEVIITINADFSMTVLKSLADGFVVMSKQA
jgi:HK97 family phage major capsid protein